jgi:glyoxylase-like metal-dependent hydrolase (beta-lactamase superfamily II)
MRMASMLVVAAAVGTAGAGSSVKADEVLDIRRYTQEGVGSVNSFIVETTNGVVLVDSQRVLSQGEIVANAVGRIGKPLLAVLITHAHPDHFGGVAAIVEAFPDTPVYASEATIEEMRTDSNGFMAATRNVAPDDTPQAVPLPTNAFADAEVLAFDGVDFVVDEIGAGEAEAMTMFYVPDANTLFVGDLISYGMTGFLLEGRLEEWLEQLRAVDAKYAATAPMIMPGHGAPGEFVVLLDWQQDYLSSLDELVRNAREDGAVSEEEFETIVANMNALYPEHDPVAAIPNLLELNIRALTRRP